MEEDCKGNNFFNISPYNFCYITFKFQIETIYNLRSTKVKIFCYYFYFVNLGVIRGLKVQFEFLLKGRPSGRSSVKKGHSTTKPTKEDW